MPRRSETKVGSLAKADSNVGRAALLRGLNISAARQHRPVFRVGPDFIFSRSHTALFVDGCFWHS